MKAGLGPLFSFRSAGRTFCWPSARVLRDAGFVWRQRNPNIRRPQDALLWPCLPFGEQRRSYLLMCSDDRYRSSRGLAGWAGLAGWLAGYSRFSGEGSRRVCSLRPFFTRLLALPLSFPNDPGKANVNNEAGYPSPLLVLAALSVSKGSARFLRRDRQVWR